MKEKNSLSRSELIKIIALKHGLSRNAAQVIIEDVFSTIKELTKGDREVRITKFGAFRQVTRQAHKARHPQTGEIIDIPTRVSLRFRGYKI